MTGFAVDLAVLQQGATDMYTLANRVTWAKYHAKAHVSSSIKGGTWFYDAGQEINDLGDAMAITYDHAEVRGLFDNASIALQQMVRDYETVDSDAARRAADGKADELLAIEPAKSLTSALNGRKPSIASISYEDAFSEPEDEYDSWNTFVSIGASVTYWTSLEFVGEPLEKLGLDNPIQKAIDKFQGDWPRLGRAIAAVSQLATYWRAIAADVARVRAHLAAGWSGVAADETLGWFDKLETACRDHGYSLSGFATRVRTEAVAMKTAADLISDVVGDLLGVLPDLEGGLLDKVGDVAGSVLRGVGKVIDIVDKVFLALNASLTVAYALLAVFSQFSDGDGEFAHVSKPLALDVNG